MIFIQSYYAEGHTPNTVKKGICMNKKVLLLALIAGHLSLLHCMETSSQTSDTALQKLITVVNKNSFNIVNLVKKKMQHQCMDLTPHHISFALALEKEHINNLFLDHINDDDLRPMFLAMGADVKARKKESGFTCLHYARKPTAFRELITAGAEIEAITDNKHTPLAELLYLAGFDENDETIESAQILLEHKANPNIDLGPWGSLLCRVLNYRNATMRFKTAQLLCKFGAKVNTQTEENKKTPILIAVQEGLTDIVELFLPQLTPDEINALIYYKESLLHVALEKDTGYFYDHSSNVRKIVPKIVLLLLQHKANPNIAYNDGKTMPLHVAVDRGQEEIIKELVKCGARKDLTDNQGKTPYMIAKNRRYKQDILDVLYTDIIIKDSVGDDVVVLKNENSSSTTEEREIIATNDTTSHTCVMQ